MVFYIPRSNDLELDYAHQENMEYEQLAVLANYSHAKKNNNKKKRCRHILWQ